MIKVAWGLKLQLKLPQCCAVSLPWPHNFLDLALKGRSCVVSAADVVEDPGTGDAGLILDFRKQNSLGLVSNSCRCPVLCFGNASVGIVTKDKIFQTRSSKIFWSQWDFLINMAVGVLCSCEKPFTSHSSKPMGRSSLSAEKCIAFILLQRSWMGFSWKIQKANFRAWDGCPHWRCTRAAKMPTWGWKTKEIQVTHVLLPSNWGLSGIIPRVI